MSKIIESTVKEYPGTFEVPDELTWDQLVTWADMVAEFKGNKVQNTLIMARYLPKIIKVDIAGFPDIEKGKPPKPLAPLTDLMNRIIAEMLPLTGEYFSPFGGGASTGG